jgi:hypothetical protein
MAAKHFRVTIDSKTGKATGDVVPLAVNEETDIGDRGVFCHHLVLAVDPERAKIAAEQDHAEEKDVCPQYPKRTKAVDVVE